jgi:hypothetical protein
MMAEKAESCGRHYHICTLLVVLFQKASIHGINILLNFDRIFMDIPCEGRKIIMEYSP